MADDFDDIPFGPFRRPPRKRTIQERFEAFNEANPWVLIALEALTRDLVERGRSHFGIKMLWEVLRWQYYRRTTEQDEGGFKISNDYHSRYVRRIIERHPEWDGVFEMRPLRAD